jgi:integrase
VSFTPIGVLRDDAVEVHFLNDLDDFFSAAAFDSSSYFNSHVSVFRDFFKWCRARGIVPMNFDPMFGREHAPNPPAEKKYIPVEQFGDLLSAAENPRDRMIVALGLYLFLRQGEISTLRVEDIRDDRIGVRVWKTGQFDRMQINTELAEELVRWLRVYRPPSGFLCPSTRLEWGHRVHDPNRQFLRPYKAVQRALASLGWEDEEIDGEGGHLLRRSGARALYFALRDQGSERAMALVQRRLHHKNRDMTERYIGVTADDAELGVSSSRSAHVPRRRGARDTVEARSGVKVTARVVSLFFSILCGIQGEEPS